MGLITAKHQIRKVFSYDEPVPDITEDDWNGYGKVYKFKFDGKIIGGLLADLVTICKENDVFFSIISEDNRPVLVIHQ